MGQGGLNGKVKWEVGFKCGQQQSQKQNAQLQMMCWSVPTISKNKREKPGTMTYSFNPGQRQTDSCAFKTKPSQKFPKQN